MLAHQFESAQKPARVIILGASGFLAVKLAKGLVEDQIVYRSVGSKEVDLIEPASADKLAGLLQADDALVVTSALTPDKGRDVTTLMKNLRMAENICTALARARCAHVVYISSDAVYDTRSALIDEQSTCEPSDLYALMHIAREKMLGHTCLAAKISLAIVRPCAVYGVGDTHNSYGPNRFMRTALSDGAIRLFGEGEEQRDHVFASDVVEIVKLCLLHRSAGVLNAASGKAISFRQVAQYVVDAVKRDVRVEPQARTGPVTHRHFDITALVRCFPRFRPTAAQAGIAQSVSELLKAV